MTGAVFLAAGLVDLALGEPRRAHPVRGMGRLLEAGRRWNQEMAAPSASSRRLTGALLALGGGCLVAQAARRLDGVLAGLPVGRTMARGVALSMTFSLRELVGAGRSVRKALERGDLPEARARLGLHLVSRETGDLSSSEVAGAAIQSLAENFNDSVVAPLLWARLGGPGAAWAFRFLNTADAMLGYRTEELEDLGLVAARTDDLAGLFPARLSAALLVAGAPLVGGSARVGARVARHDHGRTPSPNGGWPMAAAAGVLGVRLEKRGVYRLNSGGREPGARDLRRVERLVLAAGVATLAAAGLSGGRP